MKKKFSKRERIIFVICVLLVFVYVGYREVICKWRQKMTTIEQEILIQEGKLKAGMRELQEARLFDLEYQRYANFLTQKEPNEEVVAALSSVIQYQAQTMGLQLSMMKPEKAKNMKNYNRFPINVSLQGDFQQMMRFLHLIQSTPHYFNIDELQMEKVHSGEEMKGNFIISKIFIPG